MRHLLWAMLVTLTMAMPGWAQTSDPRYIQDPRSRCEVWNPMPQPHETVYWSGECTDGRAQGQGVLTWLLSGKPYGVYVGEMKDGKQHGHGTYNFADGSSYVGDFRDGRPNGKGTGTSPDGRKYVGEVQNGRRHGHGTLTLADGAVWHSGMWLLDKPVGELSATSR